MQYKTIEERSLDIDRIVGELPDEVNIHTIRDKAGLGIMDIKKYLIYKGYTQVKDSRYFWRIK